MCFPVEVIFYCLNLWAWVIGVDGNDNYYSQETVCINPNFIRVTTKLAPAQMCRGNSDVPLGFLSDLFSYTIQKRKCCEIVFVVSPQDMWNTYLHTHMYMYFIYLYIIYDMFIYVFLRQGLGMEPKLACSLPLLLQPLKSLESAVGHHAWHTFPS